MRNRKRIFVLVSACLCAAEVFLALLSWVLSALFPGCAVRSLLAPAGLRWLLSSYAANVRADAALYCLLAAFALGAFFSSGLARRVFKPGTPCSWGGRLAAAVFYAGMAAALCFSLSAAFYPHSFLLGVNGTVWPGPYWKAVFVIFAAVTAASSCLFVLLDCSSGAAEGVFRALTAGLRAAVPFMVLYFLAAETVCSVLYVAGLPVLR